MKRYLFVIALSCLLLGSGENDETDGTEDSETNSEETIEAGTILVPEDADTIQRAVDLAQPGDQVLVGAGTYNESVTLKSDIQLVGTGFGETILKTDHGPAILIDNLVNVEISEFKFTGTANPAIVVRNRSKEITLSFNHFEYLNRGIEMERSRGTITGNSFMNLSGSNSMGIYCYDRASPTIASNLFLQNSFGIVAENRSHPVILNNTMVDGETAVEIRNSEDTPSSSPWLLNNIVSSHTQAFVAPNGGEPESISHNILWENETDYWGLIASETDFYLDPKFKAPSTGDYRLGARSPAIDKGFGGEMAPELDLDQQERLNDGDGNGSFQIDIGAYEFKRDESYTPSASASGRHATGGRDANAEGCNAVPPLPWLSFLVGILLLRARRQSV